MTWGPLLVPQQFFPLLVTVTLHPSFSTILRTQQRRPILLELCSCNKRLGLQTGILGERKSQWLMFHWKYTRQVLLIKINLLLHKPAALALVSLPLIETRSHKTRGGGGGRVWLLTGYEVNKPGQQIIFYKLMVWHVCFGLKQQT